MNEEDSIIAELTLDSTPILQRSSTTCTFVLSDDGDDIVVTDANFKARHHLFGDCLAHPWGCDCEKFHRPTMGQNEALQLLALRFKAVHHPIAPLPHAANAPHVEDLREWEHIDAVLDALLERVPRRHPVLSSAVERRMRANAVHIRERQERGSRGAKSIEKVLPRHPARSTGPAVLAVPTRVTSKRKLQAVGHDNRTGAASRHGGAGDVPPTSPARLFPLSERTGGVRIKSAHT
jgi:hypothetical protein